MKKIIFLVLLTVPFTGFCQEVKQYSDRVYLGDMMRANPEQLKNLEGRSYGTEGTPYVLKDFTKGDIFFSDKTAARNKLINYDCYNNRVLFKQDEVNYIVDSRKIDYIKFYPTGHSTVLFKKVFLMEQRKIVLMKILYHKESTLYRYYYKTFREADYTGAYSQDKRYDEFIDEHQWYIEPGGAEIRRLRPKKKSILEAFKAYRNDIEQYLKNEKPDLKSDRDLIRLVEYYDNLLAGS